MMKRVNSFDMNFTCSVYTKNNAVHDTMQFCLIPAVRNVHLSTGHCSELGCEPYYEFLQTENLCSPKNCSKKNHHSKKHCDTCESGYIPTTTPFPKNTTNPYSLLQRKYCHPWSSQYEGCKTLKYDKEK